MSAEILRRAASLMRERAEAATPGPWTRDSGWSFTAPPPEPDWQGPYMVGETPRRNDATYLASWHPAVAVAVVDLLIEASVDWPEHPAALAVARAYLGESA